MQQDHLLQEKISKLFVRYALPSMLSMFGMSLYVFADTYFIATGVGAIGLTALNIVLPFYSLIFGLGHMIGIGGAIVYTLDRVAGRKEEADGVFSLSLCLAAVPAILFMILGCFFANELCTALGASPDALPYSVTYVQVVALFTPMFMANSILSAFVRNDHAPNLAMAGMIAGALFNIVFDYIFIFPMKMGMFGAALATAISPVIGILVQIFHFFRKKNGFGFHKFTFRWSTVGRIARGGTNSLITELAGGIVVFAFNAAILTRMGDVGVAAYGIIANIAMVAVSLFNGISQGIQPLISANASANQGDRCRQALRIANVTAFGVGLLLWLCSILFPGPIIEAFNRDGVALLTQYASEGIGIYFSSFLLAGINIVVASYFQARLMSKQSIALALCRGFFAILAGLWTLPFIFGNTGIWLTVPFAELVTLIVALIFLKLNHARTDILPEGPLVREEQAP
ncbi:MATE family efflux transporter [Gehongia tenuis]|uniref:Multidrug export protein MepA n=1 Tax=Gehongia tenuis TaxID=2763655 RepID=A0A926HPH7_9FIRM|nr:MATE family efflux transporter [Gehongia tenuis]MBC8531228.1 MATE family efflux transporter [Gehongia tenuis]